MKTVLLTGCCGLIAGRLSKWILENTDYYVVGVDNLSQGYIDNFPKSERSIFYNTDAGASRRMDYIFDTHKPEIVYIMHCYAAEGYSPFIRCFNYQNNLVSVANVINKCITYEVGKVVFTSSMSVYGRGKPPFDERDPLAPIDPYANSKLACETDLQIAGEQHGLKWCIVRPHNFYGIGQTIHDKFRNVLGIWFYQFLHGEPMTIFGSGEQRRSFSYIDDSLESFWKAAILPETTHEIINLGGTHNCSINEANQILREVVGGGEIVHLEARHEVFEAYPTFDKSMRLLGYEDKTDLRTGLSVMYEWIKTLPEQPRFKGPEIELRKGLYSFWS